jgi:hypothetical protein
MKRWEFFMRKAKTTDYDPKGNFMPKKYTVLKQTYIMTLWSEELTTDNRLRKNNGFSEVKDKVI